MCVRVCMCVFVYFYVFLCVCTHVRACKNMAYMLYIHTFVCVWWHWHNKWWLRRLRLVVRPQPKITCSLSLPLPLSLSLSLSLYLSLSLSLSHTHTHTCFYLVQHNVKPLFQVQAVSSLAAWCAAPSTWGYPVTSSTASLAMSNSCLSDIKGRTRQ